MSENRPCSNSADESAAGPRSTLSLASLLAEPAKRAPGRTAVVEGRQHFGYGELWEQVRGYAAVLRELGVAEGSRVALVAPNVVDFVRVYYAVQTLGAVVVPVPLLLVPEEAEHLVVDSEAELIVGHTGQLELARGCSRLAGVRLVTVGPREEGQPEHGLDELARSAEPVSGFVSRQPQDPAVIFYTSGTTGKPKGAVLTQLNMVMNATVNAFDANETTPRDRVLGCLPLFHVFGQTVSMNTTFRAGATLVLQPGFDPAQALELIREHEITQFNGVPTMYGRMLEAAEEGLELPSLRLCISGGAALPVRVLERFNERFDTRILEGYGLSETSPTATVNQPALGTRAGTVGHPLWGIEVEIAEPDAERIELLESGATGEVVVRGHNVFAGYLNDPEATAAVLVDGWFRTGDIGRKDEDGFLSIVDRKKDLIIRNGYNVYPREVEETLLEHPAVKQVAVIGLPDEVRGEEVCAVVVPADKVDTDQSVGDWITEWAARRLAAHKYPRRVSFVAELPLGPSHKVLKRELRTRVIAELRRTNDSEE
ncbi:long-chain-fatty-acid--CoA ligase [Actinopolyspora saharensis]|uniref:Long-chain acyl-CoA synthetase n=1 Tax=Actinopolyspora saharensis TaxID=995062 RepID=A0A1H1ALS8_9ACTN|nr:long-chain fatty acid--CoA ligase [Actinopolyspora saharensis]SDQ40639.1 long-chain acyl-CoA synthetase [Actinopolyspora saharensis]